MGDPPFRSNRAIDCKDLVAALILCAIVAIGGCERKEKILDIETPDKSIEIERSKDTGDVEIDIQKPE